MFIENTTPYMGKLRLKFEKYPEYSDGSVYNKTHINLGFTKLVSRMHPKQTKEGYSNLDPDKVQLILSHTNGKVGIHEWWDCSSKKTGNYKKKYTKPDPNIWDVQFHGKLPESFVSHDEQYIGDVARGWWYYKNKLKVYNPYPLGVAIKYYDDSYKSSYITESGVEGFYGYSHRGGALFRLGDRIFEESYEPKEEDYEDWQWAGFVDKYNKNVSEAKKAGDDFWLDSIRTDGIAGVIPFNMRGEHVIHLFNEAAEAAINLSNYLG